MERKIWLEEAIEEYVKNNPNMDSVDITIHFNLRPDITLYSLQELINQGKVIRKHIFGFRYGYVITAACMARCQRQLNLKHKI